MSDQHPTYLSEIISSLEQLGGAASLKEINETIRQNGTLPSIFTNPKWTNNVSAEIQRHCRATKSYRGADDLFYSVYGLGEGYWGLNTYKEKLANFDELNPIEQRQIQTIETNTALSDTEKKQVILARRGQGIFRNQLIEKYRVCIVTGIEDKRLLAASHIKPWRNSTDSERLSIYNGLLLSSLYDKLFDVGLITFTKNGNISVSPELSMQDKYRINIDENYKYLQDIPTKLRINIEYHNDVIFHR